MSEMSLFEIYHNECKNLLQSDNPEGVQTVFELMESQNPEFRVFFINKLPNWVLINYLSKSVASHDVLSVMLEWQENNQNWKEDIKDALLNNSLGSVSRNLKNSVILFNSSKNNF